MQITEEQKKIIRKWAEEGSSLPEIQKRLSGELGISMTFMDVRLLAIDLGLKVKEKASGKVEKKPELEDAVADASGVDDLSDAADSGRGPAGVTVQVDRILKPGTVVSGRVTFSDGVAADWGLDQLGRLGLSGCKKGYSPSESDLRQFQAELRKVLAQKGF
jgi:hypothetical protein